MKTTYKTRRIELHDNKIYSFYFIKSFIKCIKLGYEFIFADESKIEIRNNHYRAWRKTNEEITFGINNNLKKNLFLVVGKIMYFFIGYQMII